MSSERQPPDDHELEDFLAGRHPVGRAYREASENESAPPELDAAILAAARDAARAPVARRRPLWVRPVAFAATLVLGLSVLMNVWRDPEMREQVVPLAPPAPESQPVNGESTAEMQSLPSAAADAPATPVPSDLPEKRKLQRAAPKAEAPANDALPSPPTPPGSNEAIERDQPIAGPYAMEEDVPSRERAPAMAPPTASVPAPASAAPDPRRESEARERLYDDQRQRSLQKVMPSAPVQEPADQLGASDTGSAALMVERWIEQIRDEIARGDEEAARDSLLQFRSEHPDAVLPADLAAFEGAER